MSTTNEPFQNETKRIVVGPANVTVNFKTGVGEFYIMDATTQGGTPPSPTASLVGSYLGIQPESMALEADQALDVRGSGLLVVQSKTRAS